MKYDVIIIGAGAAGFFTAIQIAENNPHLKIIILEKTQKLLSKVKISGGGRCNVTHGCFDPRELISFYPRGSKELLGPFHKFMCGDMMGWLEYRGVEIKIEDDGRAFPVSNDSQTIIDCFLDEIHKHSIKIEKGVTVKDVKHQEDQWHLETASDKYITDKLVFTTGSSRSMWKILQSKGHNLIEPVPSLFTFKIKDPLIKDLMGLSIKNGSVKVLNTKLEEEGPVLITHWGLSGPGILKLSSRGARELFDKNYQFNIAVNWTEFDPTQVEEKVILAKKDNARKQVINTPLLGIPKRLWARFVEINKLNNKNWGDITKIEFNQLVKHISAYEFRVTAKATNKDEFVTAGGIDLNEVNFKNMESKILPNVFFAGEILNIDALTGGFNFQSAWTTSYLIGQGLK